MSKYNIIYISPGHEHYLWNGFSLDKLNKTEQEVLAFSGKNFQQDEIAPAKEACHAEVKNFFRMTPLLKLKQLRYLTENNLQTK